MFGAEGDRITAMRAQQQQQYAEDLRRQIEEKQNKALRQKRTPPSYSTTTNDTMQDTINSINFNSNSPKNNNGNNNNNNNINSPNTNNFNVRPPNMARQNQAPRGTNYMSPSRNDNYSNDTNTNNSNNNDFNDNYSNDNNNYGNNYQSRITNYGSSHEDYYSIPTTSTIAPLSLNVQPPSSVMTTTYMLGPTTTMTRGALNTDKSTFPTRIDSLETRLFNLREELTVRTEKVNEFNDSIFPSIGRDINDLRNKIELESSQDIPIKTQPVRNSIKEQRNLIENANQIQREAHSNIGSSFSELNAKINGFLPQFNDLQETTKSSFVTLRGDISRQRNMLETSNSKIGKIDSQDRSIVSKLSAQNEDFNQIDQGLTQSFDNFQVNTNEIMLNISSQLAYDIQSESQKREVVSTKLQSQVSEVNNRSKSAISRLSQNISQLDFKDSLEEISKQIASAMNVTNNDTDVKLTDLTRRFDSFLANCEENFVSIQNETVSTIDAIRKNHMGSKDVLEDCLEQEIRVRTKNANEIMTKYAQFRELVQQEEKLQMENCNRNFNDLTFQIKSSINDQTTPMYKDVHGAVYLISHIEETEAKLDKIERMINDANNNLRGKMSAFQIQFKNFLIQINNDRNSMMSKFDQIDKKIDLLQQKNNKNSILKRTEIYAIQKVIETGLDAKVTSIEEEISQILKQIAAIQFPQQKVESESSRPNSSRKSRRSKKSNTDGRTEGSILLESLVNENNNKKANTCLNNQNKTNTKGHTIIGEPDNSLFLTNNKTMEITTDTDTDANTNASKNDNEEETNSNNNTENTNNDKNNDAVKEEEDVGNDADENYSKIGSNVWLETCQKFHFVPPEDIFDNPEADENNDSKSPKNGDKRASTVKFALDINANANDNDNDNNIALASGRTKSLSMPKLSIQGANQKSKFKVDTSFSSNSIKQHLLSVNGKRSKESTSMSNSSSSANQRDESPLTTAEVKLPFSRTNEIEQVLKPEALATLPPHSMSQVIESPNKIISDDSMMIEEEEEEGEEDETNGKSGLSELEQVPPELTAEGNNIEEFKFNPNDFKIDLNIGNKNKNEGQLEQKVDNLGTIMLGNMKNNDGGNNAEEKEGEINFEEDDDETEDDNENEDA